MIKRIFTALSVLMISTMLLPTAHPATAAATSPEPFAGLPLCLPNVYLQAPSDCLALGPSTTLTELARKGLYLPLRPLPAASPSPELTQVSVQFARIALDSGEKAPIYATLEDAQMGGNPVRWMAAGPLRFITYRRRVDFGSGHYLELQTGEWMRASPTAYPMFQGLVFRQNPVNSFGWIIENTISRSAPSEAAPETGKEYLRETPVQVYEKVVVDKTEWFMIGVDEWVERRYIRAVKLNTTPPKGVTNNRWIEVNLYEQIVTVYDEGRLVFATLVSSGAEPFYTMPGLFKVYKKVPLETMSGAFEADKSDYYYLESVPWTMYFDQNRALHGAYWRPAFGVPQTHGCVNFSIGDARWLFDWAKNGDWVYVWDPSGKTPVDPKLYTAGGA